MVLVSGIASLREVASAGKFNDSTFQY